jgi:CheY-like chemotaxis protein
MKSAIKREFGPARPRAAVIDDEPNALRMTARALRRRGFGVEEFNNPSDFLRGWLPGTVDVIVADWELTSNHQDDGDRLLEQVRLRDWDVSFVLVSGKLGDAQARAGVLARLLESGSARFVTRGDEGIERSCAEAEALLERRDLALLKVILSLRDGALQGAALQTSSGMRAAARILEEVVSKPSVSHDAERPVAASLANRRRDAR